MKTIALIDYGSGNLHSAGRALRVAANNAKKTREIRVTSDPDALRHADRIVLPGVGHFADCMANLTARDGLIEALREEVLVRGKPFLGICVGMQLVADRGLEDGETAGLGWIGGDVEKIMPGPGHRIPHMGWNGLRAETSHALLEDIEADAHVYFVHSYALNLTDKSDLIATTDYGGAMAALVGRDNIAGTQFHPEKSQKTGLKLLSNFVRWSP